MYEECACVGRDMFQKLLFQVMWSVVSVSTKMKFVRIGMWNSILPNNKYKRNPLYLGVEKRSNLSWWHRY